MVEEHGKSAVPDRRGQPAQTGAGLKALGKSDGENKSGACLLSKYARRRLKQLADSQQVKQ